MSVLRGLASFGVFVSLLMLVGAWLERESRLHAETSASSLVGAWTLNRDLSDSNDSGTTGGDDRGGSSGRHGGGAGHGGFGGGFGRGGGGRSSGGTFDREQVARQRNALREIMNPPEHLTIVQTDSLIVITGPDGRTTRLSPDGKKIKDNSTQLERKTKWDGGKLVSEITGVGSAKITETYSVDAEHHQLRIAGHLENGQRTVTTTHVYDADSDAR